MSVVPFGRWTIVSRPVTSWTTTVPSGRVVRDTELTGGAFLGRLRQGAIVALLVMVLLGECSLFPGAATAVPPVSHATLAVQPAEEEAASAALAAAAAIFDALTTPDCTTPNPDGRACVRLESVPAVVARGIAHIGVGDVNGIGGTNAILGRDVTGVWRVWFTTQNFYYQTLVLPSEMLVCADGAGANVRSAPAVDAAVITALPDLTQVTVEEFVLTEEQAVDASGGAVAGAGWYRLSAPLEGWTSSRLLSNTFVDAAMQQPACWARDQREGATEGGR